MKPELFRYDQTANLVKLPSPNTPSFFFFVDDTPRSTKAHHIKAGGMYDDVLNGLGVGSACRGDTADGRLLAGFTATPRRLASAHGVT